MPATESARRICSKCGAAILPEGNGHCSACLLETALDALTDDAGDGGPPRVLSDFGDYELLEEIGRGGQGVVYRARQKSLNRVVALKVIGLGHWATEAHVKRFRLEAEAAAQLDHPSIVPIYEIGERDGSCYFSMKYVEGGPLDELVRRKPLSIQSATELLAKIARTVHHAHGHGVLHRDIKPGNILLDEAGEPHLTDFGLARLVEKESNVTRTMDVLGTPSYMAPEQAAGRNTQLTGTTDVYGLGAVFYQLLTGQPPFAGGTTFETIRLVLETEPRHPRLWNPKVDGDIATICLKCLEKDPPRRYASALTLAEDLERWLRHEPIHARRSGPINRGRKWVRRNPVLAAVTPVVTALVAVVAVMFWNQARARPVASGIAVLPFEDLSGDKQNAFFADGMQDDILTKLAKVADLKVISRTSVMQYRGERNVRKIGEALRVSHVLEGSVRRTNDRIRLNAQLIDARNDAHVWAQSYDREITDVFAIQSEIAKAIADQLQAKILPREKLEIEQPPTKDLVAYDLYARANEVINADFYSDDRKEHLARAINWLEQAIGRDPAFFDAYCKLARVHAILYVTHTDHTPERLSAAEEAAKAALRLQPDAAEAHLARAWHLLAKLDYDGARAEMEFARRTLPNDPRIFELTAYIDRRQGRWSESLRNLERALELDPNNTFILQQTANTHQQLRQYHKQAATFDRVLSLRPNDLVMRIARAHVEVNWKADPKPLRELIDSLLRENPGSGAALARDRISLAFAERDPAAGLEAVSDLGQKTWGTDAVLYPPAYLEGLFCRLKGDAAAAEASFSRARAIQQQILDRDPDYAPGLCILGLIDAGLGRKEEALREGRRAAELLPPSRDSINGQQIMQLLAVIYAWVGEKDLAIDQLDRSVQLPSRFGYGHFRLFPEWDPLRGDPRFEKIVAWLAPKDDMK